jgi:hypothetical protein
LMAAGWALNVRGYALSAVALVLIVVSFKYDRVFKRGGSSTEYAPAASRIRSHEFTLRPCPRFRNARVR